jgi:DNA (cytosine-5)-methyltransferase 1
MSVPNADSSGEPTVISLFAGCGGSSLGYQLAGFRELLAVETFRLNFPGVPVYHGDICKLTSEECMRLAGIGPRELDVLDGSPPCQGFSTAGKRRFTDPRNSLSEEYVRLLRDLQPRAFVFENVTGMVKGVMKQAYLQIVASLRACGYRVKGQVMNAMYFNVPQSRERVIILGVREDLGIEPSHPKPQTRPVTVREALGAGCECAAPYPSGKVRLAIEGNSSYRRKWRGSDRPCPTLQASRALLVNEGGAVRDMRPDEAARLQSFPDTFSFTDDAQRRIGNSVPPNLMRAIAEHVRREILEKVRVDG